MSGEVGVGWVVIDRERELECGEDGDRQCLGGEWGVEMAGEGGSGVVR